MAGMMWPLIHAKSAYLPRKPCNNCNAQDAYQPCNNGMAAKWPENPETCYAKCFAQQGSTVTGMIINQDQTVQEQIAEQRRQAKLKRCRSRKRWYDGRWQSAKPASPVRYIKKPDQ